MAKSITTSSCRIHFNFTNVNWPPSIISHSYSDVLSKQGRTTEEGNTSSLGNTEATATQGIGDTIITGCWTCMTEQIRKVAMIPESIFLLDFLAFTLRLFYSSYDPSILGLKIERDSVTSRNMLGILLLKSIFFD